MDASAPAILEIGVVLVAAAGAGLVPRRLGLPLTLAAFTSLGATTIAVRRHPWLRGA